MTKALLFDDSKSFLNILHNALTTAGFVVISTSNKKDFFFYLKAFKPDVVLVDVFQQKVDGRTICKQINENQNFSNIPVILMSENPYALTNYAEFGAIDSIVKSSTVSEMVEKIKHTAANNYQFITLQKNSNRVNNYSNLFIHRFSLSSITKLFF